jgi:TonB family protein
MSTPTEVWRKWEGRVVNEKFPLRQWLGGSDHSAVFLTARDGTGSQRAVIKLIPVEALHREKQDKENVEEDAQLSGWADAAKLSHPHLIRLFECGRCQVDGTRLLYVVTEYAEENLAEILPLRPLSRDEAFEMLRPTAEALASLHQAGFAHGGIKPSNIMAVDNQLKISTDGLRRTGEHSYWRTPSTYDAPEVVTGGVSTAADLWSLGVTLVAVLTQQEPKSKNGEAVPVAVPETVPQPFREIARRCLQVDPKQRGTATDVLRQIQPQPGQTPPHLNQVRQEQPPQNQTFQNQTFQNQAPLSAHATQALPSQGRRKLRIIVPIVMALLFVAWMGVRLMIHQPPVPAAETHPASQPATDVPATQSPAPFSEKGNAAQKGTVRGSVLQQVLPDVSPGAQGTIEGRLKVSVQVAVDASGNVSDAKLVSPGPSKYFASRAMAAARRWKFDPARMDGQPAPSVWVLRFQFRRTSTEVVPAEIKP